MTITESELLEALRAATPRRADGPTDAYTTREIRKATGWGLAQAMAYLRSLADDGRLEAVKVRRTAIDGRLALVTAYRFLTPKGKKR